jgi:hypothetical protein
MNILKQSTAVTIKLGPYLDSTDAVTAKTALTIAQANVLLSKNFGAFAQKSDATSATHDSSGWYGVPLNTTDTGTVGPLQIHTNISTALPVFRQYLVVPANVYDSLTGAANLKVDVDQIKTGSTAASNLAASTPTGGASSPPPASSRPKRPSRTGRKARTAPSPTCP